MRSLTRQQVRRVDQTAIDSLGIPGIVLMENAGRNAAEASARLLHEKSGKVARGAYVAVICGGGNNGGDGYVVARHLHNRGAHVAVFAAKDPADLAGDALTNARIIQRMAVPIRLIDDPGTLGDAADHWRKADLIVDALLGTGFTGELRPATAKVITACNQSAAAGAAVVALDLPSGLDCDTGLPAHPTICADLTVTFAAPKIGFDHPAAHEHLGRVVVAEIGVPPELLEQVVTST